MKKIHIIGSVGSGKTTLAKELSSKLDIPFYELDNVVWERHKSGDIRRTEQERDEYLNQILQAEKWIIEGVHNEDWVSDSFHQAELIIFLDTQYSIRTWRIIKRYIKQKLYLEKANYKPTFRIFLKMFKWNRYFEEVGKVNFFNKYEIHNGKTAVIKTKKDPAAHHVLGLERDVRMLKEGMDIRTIETHYSKSEILTSQNKVSIVEGMSVAFINPELFDLLIYFYTTGDTEFERRFNRDIQERGMDVEYLKQSHNERRIQYDLFMHPYSKNFDIIIMSSDDSIKIEKNTVNLNFI